MQRDVKCFQPIIPAAACGWVMSLLATPMAATFKHAPACKLQTSSPGLRGGMRWAYTARWRMAAGGGTFAVTRTWQRATLLHPEYFSPAGQEAQGSS